ncbi:MAG: carbon starvation CstA family protein, partial [Planctomycetaceae bacterium]
GRIITPRARVLFLFILFFALTIVLAIFGLVIAKIFSMYPSSVLSVWIELPLAVMIGFWVYRGGAGLLWPSILGLLVMYGSIWVGVYYLPITLPVSNPIVVWTLLLMTYCFVASVLPVWVLLQPRDYINSHQLVVALGLLVMGLLVAGFRGDAQLATSAPAIATQMPLGAPPIWPFLFITIACGAISGFHCLVSSGTSSKQISSEIDSQYVGYGAMLLEGALAVIVILACCAGVGMGKFELNEGHYQAATTPDGKPLTGHAAWSTLYNTKTHWKEFNLGDKVGAFVEGGANFLTALGLRLELAIGIIAVLVASFAATTLDTATRLQRYVIQELGETLRLRPLTNKYAATGCAVLLGASIAMLPAPGSQTAGTGGMILWPLFGATNQLLAGLAFMVIVFYLHRRQKPIIFAVLPMLIMLVMPAAALTWNLFNADSGWVWPLWSMASGQAAWTWTNTHLLFAVGLGAIGLEAWMIVEAVLLWPHTRGVLEDSLPPLPVTNTAGGVNC